MRATVQRFILKCLKGFKFMQKIILDGDISTFDQTLPKAKAMLINDESIVFTGENEEVLSMKNDDTEILKLDGKSVFPSFFEMGINLFNEIENNLKNANLVDFIENLSEFDLNYDKFVNFDIYKEEFLKLQRMLIQCGITTIFETGMSCKEFIFWKKISEQKLLKIDIVGFVDIINFKQVMDENCRSYRKYKNHFRLGGYSISLDGKLEERRAWIKKPYKKEGKYCGFAYVGDEQLSVLIKASLDEKKQILVEANGERSVEQFLRCYEEKIKDKEKSDLISPIFKTSACLNKGIINRLKENRISVIFDLYAVAFDYKNLKTILGRRRLNKLALTKLCEENEVKFSVCSSGLISEKLSLFETLKFLTERIINGKKLGGSQKLSLESALRAVLISPAELCIETNRKGSLENGKVANFVIFDRKITDNFSDLGLEISKTFIDGSLEYEKK